MRMAWCWESHVIAQEPEPADALLSSALRRLASQGSMSFTKVEAELAEAFQVVLDAPTATDQPVLEGKQVHLVHPLKALPVADARARHQDGI